MDEAHELRLSSNVLFKGFLCREPAESQYPLWPVFISSQSLPYLHIENKNKEV